MSKLTAQELQSEMRELEEEYSCITQRLTSLKSMLAKYVEAKQNDKTKNRPK